MQDSPSKKRGEISTPDLAAGITLASQSIKQYPSDDVRQLLLAGSLSKMDSSCLISCIVFVDDGCSTMALMDESWALDNDLPLNTLLNPINVTLADKKPHSSGPITTQTASLRLTLGSHYEIIKFLIIKNLAHPILLGLPWMRTHNPSVNWRKLTFTFNDCNNHGQPSSIIQVVPPVSTPLPPVLIPKNARAPQTTHDGQLIDFEMLNSIDFLASAKNESLEIFVVYFVPNIVEIDGNETISINSIVNTHEYAKSHICMDDKGIPDQYRQFASLFSQKDATLPLPIHRPYDLKIELDSEKPLPPPGKIYPLAPDEEKKLYEYIEKALSRGWITESDPSCPVAAPCFFVRKPNGGLRLCIDYRLINDITVRDRFPIPLMTDVFDKLHGANIFTQLDLPDAYHLMRMASGHQWKTSFRCKFGQYQYEVLPFGLTNCPPVFQRFMQEMLAQFIKENFLIVYLDNIFIYSKVEDINNPVEHVEHVTRVLQQLLDNHLYVSVTKCSFHVLECDLFGYLVSNRGLRMNPEKIAPVKEWPRPETVKQLQSFLAFSNFYKRFIKNFSKICNPMNRLLRKNVPFAWSDECNSAFEFLKGCFISAPILKFFDFTQPAILETDASDFALGSILSQVFDDVMHPIAYHSRTFLSVGEANYDTHDKELLAIVDSFKKFSHYLICADPAQPTTVFTDHNNLTYFTTARSLSRRQFRWAQFLAKFPFRIYHRSGKLSAKPDALSRRSDYLQEGVDLKDRNYLRLFEQVNFDLDSINIASMQYFLDTDPEFLQTLREETEKSKLLKSFKNLELPKDYSYLDGILYFNELIVLPSLSLQLRVIKYRHESPTVGHFGFNKTYELISRDFHFPAITKVIKKYLKGCSCVLAKASRHKPFGLVIPSSIPEAPWLHTQLDFITDLPPSDGYDSICIVKCMLTKMIHVLPCNKTISADQTAQLYVDKVFRYRGMPRSILSDRGPQFISKLWKRFFELLGCDRKLTSGYRAEPNGGSEVTNQIIEQYLRIFCNYQQDNWNSLLPLLEFAYNNSENAVTKQSPFYAVYGYHPSFDPLMITTSVSPRAEDRIELLKTNMLNLKSNLKAAQDNYVESANKKRIAPPHLEVGDLVYLNNKDYKSTRPKKKLDNKKIGPFKIITKINEVTYKLKLPHQLRIHPVFHVSLLEPASKDTFPHQKPTEPPSDIIDGVKEYEVERVLDSRKYRKSVKYRVKWKNTDEITEEPFENLTNCLEELESFHRNHPTKPRHPGLSELVIEERG